MKKQLEGIKTILKKMNEKKERKTNKGKEE